MFSGGGRRLGSRNDADENTTAGATTNAATSSNGVASGGGGGRTTTTGDGQTNRAQSTTTSGGAVSINIGPEQSDTNNSGSSRGDGNVVTIFVRVVGVQQPLGVQLVPPTFSLATTTVAQFKRLFLGVYNEQMRATSSNWVPKSKCRIIFRGRQLADTITMQSAGFEDGDQCHAMIINDPPPEQQPPSAQAGLGSAARMSRLLGISADDLHALRTRVEDGMGEVRRGVQQQTGAGGAASDPTQQDGANDDGVRQPQAMRLIDGDGDSPAGATTEATQPTAQIRQGYTMRIGNLKDEIIGWVLGFFLGFLAIPLAMGQLGTSVRFQMCLAIGIFSNFIMSLFGVVTYDVPFVK